jgi:hypothetical protein
VSPWAGGDSAREYTGHLAGVGFGNNTDHLAIIGGGVFERIVQGAQMRGAPDEA